MGNCCTAPTILQAHFVNLERMPITLESHDKFYTCILTGLQKKRISLKLSENETTISRKIFKGRYKQHYYQFEIQKPQHQHIYNPMPEYVCKLYIGSNSRDKQLMSSDFLCFKSPVVFV